MSLNKEILIDKIEVVQNGTVQVRQVTRIVENGQELSSSYHRWTIAPGEDYSSQDDRVKVICQVTHTPEVIEAYQSQIRASLERMGQ